MGLRERTERIEKGAEARLQRDRRNFHRWLRALERDRKKEFFEQAMPTLIAHGLAPEWNHPESFFALPRTDARVIEWSEAFRRMETRGEEGEAVIHRLWKSFCKNRA